MSSFTDKLCYHNTFPGVFDGHGGGACSRHISTRLFDYISASVLKQHIVTDLPIRDRLHWFFTNGDLLDEIYKLEISLGIFSQKICA